ASAKATGITGRGPVGESPGVPSHPIEWAADIGGGGALVSEIPVDAPRLDSGTEAARNAELLVLMDEAVGLETQTWSGSLYFVYESNEIRDSRGKLLGTGVRRTVADTGQSAVNAGPWGDGWPVSSVMVPGGPGES